MTTHIYAPPLFLTKEYNWTEHFLLLPLSHTFFLASSCIFCYFVFKTFLLLSLLFILFPSTCPEYHCFILPLIHKGIFYSLRQYLVTFDCLVSNRIVFGWIPSISVYIYIYTVYSIYKNIYIYTVHIQQLEPVGCYLTASSFRRGFPSNETSIGFRHVIKEHVVVRGPFLLMDGFRWNVHRRGSITPFPWQSNYPI